MSWQHYLENKKTNFLTCLPEQVYAAILESSKNIDLFQNRQTYSFQVLENSRKFLGMVSVTVQLCEKREEKQRWKILLL